MAVKAVVVCSILAIMLLSWFEIPAFNFKRAVKFYTNVLNVSFKYEAFNGVSHAIFHFGKPEPLTGAIVDYGNSYKKGDNLIGPILFFNANGIMDDLIKKIELEGGQIIQPKTLIKNQLEDGTTIVPFNEIDHNIGYYSYFRDSEGNKMGLYSHS